MSTTLDSKQSQAALILAELQARAGEWVPMPQLWQCSGSFVPSVRIGDLRKQGHVIENKLTRENGVTRSFFRLVPPPQSAIA